jgi:alanyl-tRNA synthetase
MTLRLFRADAFLKSFDARVVSITAYKNQPALVLDQTAFYPTSGGQPNDLGTIKGERLIDVVELDGKGGAIGHIFEQPFELQLGERVMGEIDWRHRFDHMQQHSGQHVLSAAFVSAAKLDTLAVHIGTDNNTLDLPTPKIEPEMIERVEHEANEIIYEDRSIVAYEVSDDAIGSVPLRKPPKVSGIIRIVEVKDYDWSACGGTHVRSTGQIGVIKIIKTEKRGNETRVTFCCGKRALNDYAKINRDVNALVETFSVLRYDTLGAVNKLRDEAKATSRALDETKAQLIAFEAKELLAMNRHAIDGCSTPVKIICVYEHRDINALRVLAKHLTNEPNVVALLGSAGEKAMLCFARSKDVSLDVSVLLKDTLKKLGDGAKGGGSPDFAQGGGVPATTQMLETILRSPTS